MAAGTVSDVQRHPQSASAPTPHGSTHLVHRAQGELESADATNAVFEDQLDTAIRSGE